MLQFDRKVPHDLSYVPADLLSAADPPHAHVLMKASSADCPLVLVSDRQGRHVSGARCGLIVPAAS